MVALAARSDPKREFERHLESGEESLLEDDAQTALFAFEAALALRPADLKALCLKASALFDLGRLEETVAIFSDVIERAPDSPVGFLGRAGALTELQKSKGTDAIGQAGVDMALADYASAYRLEDEPDGREIVHFLRGCFLEQIGAFAEAIEDFEAASALRPDAAAYLVHFSNARARSGDEEGGADAIRTMVAMLDPVDDSEADVTPPPSRPRRGRPSRA